MHLNPAQLDTANQILKLITSKSYIAIIPHINPDGDAVGSALALKETIQQFHQNVEIFCHDEAPANTLFLNPKFTKSNSINPKIYKILIFVDCGSKSQTGFEQIISNPNITTINIDHHASNTSFANYNIVCPEASSTTQILFKIFQHWNTKITHKIANYLQTGIHFDTGSFKHSNTTTDILKISSSLTKLGANNDQISKNLFKKTSTSKLRLWARIFQHTKINSKKIVTSYSTNKDLQECSANSKDLEGVIDYLNAIPNKKFSILLNQRQTEIKASLRTQEQNYDLNKISQIFGGGGHCMAAGFSIPGVLSEETSIKIK
jgi:phosphoesterase RecJ-like protein